MFARDQRDKRGLIKQKRILLKKTTEISIYVWSGGLPFVVDVLGLNKQPVSAYKLISPCVLGPRHAAGDSSQVPRRVFPSTRMACVYGKRYSKNGRTNGSSELRVCLCVPITKRPKTAHRFLRSRARNISSFSSSAE